MIHIYVSMPERSHKVYEYVGSTSTQELANLLTDPLRRYGKRGRPNIAADRLPVVENFLDVPAKFYVMCWQPDGDVPAAPYWTNGPRSGPCDKHGVAVEEPRDGRRDAMDCMATQLEATARFIREATDSSAWLDVAGGCEKQAEVGRRAMAGK